MLGEVLKARQESFGELVQLVRNTLIRKIERGSSACTSTRFLHTEPHHDDLMLGYLPYIVRNMRDASNIHYFVTLTSGFTAVTNHFMLAQLEGLQRWIDSPEFLALYREDYFDADNEQGRNRDIWQYLDGIAARNDEMRAEGAARRLLRNLMEVYDESNLSAIRDRMTELKHYFGSVYPGRKDPAAIQRLKGMCREWEAESLWGYFGWQCSHIRHSAAGLLHRRHLRARADRRTRCGAGHQPAGRGAAGRDLLCPRSGSQRSGHALQGAAGHRRGDRSLRRKARSRRRAHLGLPERLVPLPPQ